MEIMRIKMLGEFSISYRGKSINDQLKRSKKMWTLLQYLITFRNREITQSELIEMLWPQNNIANPVNALKVLLHRVRTMIYELDVDDSCQVIINRGGTCAWSPSFDYTVDTEIFEHLCQQAYSQNITIDDKITKLLEAFELYKGDFLPKSSSEQWVIPISTYYNSQYLKVIYDLAKLYQDQGKNEEIVALCQKAIILDPYEEKIHYILIKALADTGKQHYALLHYNYVKDLFLNRFGINPSSELTALYNDITKSSNTIEMNLSIIEDELKDKESSPGCFYCEYEIFRRLYQLEARSAARTGQTVFICLLSLIITDSIKRGHIDVNRIMDLIKDTIIIVLRRGDIFTRYSATQYLIMIPTITREDSEKVIRRIINNFHQSNPRLWVNIHYSLQPISPD